MQTVDRGAFAELLRHRRLAAGLTQQELAERSGISTRAVSDLERSINQRPRRDTAVMLADALGLSGPQRDTFLVLARPRPRFASDQANGMSQPTLPQPASPLVGRERELQAIADALLVDGVRLLTLTGPGGVGKTRLAIAAGHELADRLADGVLFVRLDGLHDAALVLPALAAALHLLESGGSLPIADRLAAHLSGRELLLILDNLEHLLAAAPGLADLLQRAPGVSMLVTSRESLRVRGERVMAVAPLPRPDPAMWHMPNALDGLDLDRAPAVALFVQCARAARPDLPLDAATADGRANLAIIAETCHRVDGLPLAIELAAAQVQVLSPAAVLALLKDAGLPLLALGERDQPARLQTMEAAIAWSYTLLPPAEQARFRALAVFAGGFTLPAAAAVMAPSATDPALPVDPRSPLAGLDPAVTRDIASLARQHLLVQDTSLPDHAAPRFRMLEPIRLFALDRLREMGEEATARRRHAIFFTRLAEALNPLTLGPDPEIWLRQQAIDLDNVRAALDWAQSAGEHDLLVRLTCQIAQFWEVHGLLSEARLRMAQALAVEAASSPDDRWFLRFWSVTFALDEGDVERAIAFARELHEIAEAAGDQLGIGVGLAVLSRAIGATPDRHEQAADLARRAVAILEPLGQDEWTGLGWVRVGIEYHHLGRLAEARDCLLQGLAVRKRRPCAGCAAYALASLGAVLVDLGESRAASEAYLESFALARRHDNTTLLLAVLLGLADLAWRYGARTEPERAALLVFGAAEALRRRHGLERNEQSRAAIACWQRPMRRAIGDVAADALIAAGMSLSLDEVVDIVGDLCLANPGSRATGRDLHTSLRLALGSIE